MRSLLVNQSPNQEVRLQLPSNESLTLVELSQAWEFLSQWEQSQSEELNPPLRLQKLSFLDWHVLKLMLESELEARKCEPLH